MRRKDTGNSSIKIGEGLEAVLLLVQATQKMGAYKQQRWRRLQKHHLKSEFSLLQTLTHSLSCSVHQMLASYFFLGSDS